MKTSHKVLLVIATALVVAGAALMLCAFSLAGGDIKNLSTDQHDWMHRTYEVSAEDTAALSAVSCSDGTENVIIDGYEGDTVRVEYWEHEARGVNIQEKDGTLLISGSTHGDSLEIGVFAGTYEDRSTRVLVPQEFAGDLYASSSTGDACVTGVSGAKGVSVYSENGFAIAGRLQAQTLRAESRNALVQCSTVDVSGDLIASSENGTIEIGGVLAGNMSVESENGTVSIGATSAQGTLFAASRNADVSVYNIDAPRIEVSTGNGTADISLPGGIDDYAIDASSENGYVSAPTSSNRDAARQVAARTQSGELFIEYAGGDLDAPGTVYRGETTW